MNKKNLIENLLLAGKSITEVAEEVETSIHYVREVKRRENIINGTEHMIEHHIKYKEIHGVDETVWMTTSEHVKLHNKLRKEDKCNVPVDTLTKISVAAYHRTEKRLKYNTEYGKKYNKNYIEKIDFIDTPGANTQFSERITYNYATGNISYSAWFRGAHGYKLPIVSIN